MLRNLTFAPSFSASAIASSDLVLDFVVSLTDMATNTSIAQTVIHAYTLTQSAQPAFRFDFLNYRFVDVTNADSPTFLRFRGALSALGSLNFNQIALFLDSSVDLAYYKSTLDTSYSYQCSVSCSAYQSTVATSAA